MDDKVIIELSAEQLKHLNVSSYDDLVIEKHGQHLLIKNKNNNSDIYDLFSLYEEEQDE